MANKADAVTKAIDSFIAKVRDIKFKAKVDDADIEKLTDDRKKLIGDESKLLEDHRKANKEIFTRHFYDMSNMMSRNEGVWLSNGWVKTLLWQGRRIKLNFPSTAYLNSPHSIPLSVVLD